MDLSNVRWEIIIVYLLSFIDIGLTYILLYKAKSSGIKKWYNAEQNGFIRMLLRKFGLHKGIRIGAVTTFGALTLLFGYFSLRVNWFDFSRLTFFMMGAYVIVLTYHVMFLKSFMKGGD
jgi:hypothetical protein